jgi:hypothetical protein
VVAVEVHGDLVRTEVVVLAQIEDLADDLLSGGVGAGVGTARAVAKSLLAELRVPPAPLVEDLSRDAVVPARQSDVVADLLAVADDGKTSGCVPG